MEKNQLKPARVFEQFAKINAIPRPSKHEEKMIEYLKEFGDGQLCFTTHNVGPMDILKNNKNSIDFLSINHKVYSWKKSGNYSPSNLYRNGMIEGSPFNVDAIDFIRAFDTEEDD